MGAILFPEYAEVPPSLQHREMVIVAGTLYRGDENDVPQEISPSAITRAIIIEKLGFEPADDGTLAEVAKTGQYSDLDGLPDLSIFDELQGYASKAQFPPNGDSNVELYVDRESSAMYRYDGSTYIEVSGKAPIWGDVGGDLTDQTDLAQALASKIEEIPSEYLTQTEGDDRYLQTVPEHSHAATDVQHGTRTVAAALDAKLEDVPEEYLTETEGDNRYLQGLPSHDHTAQSIEYGAGNVAEALQSLASGKADTGDVPTNEQIRDLVAALVVGGDNVSVSYDDANDRLEINSTASSSGGGLTEENVRDIVAGALAGTDGVTVNNDDSGNTLTIGFDVSQSSLGGRLSGIEETLQGKADTGDVPTPEDVRDRVAGFLRGGSSIDVSHNDSADTLTIDFTGEAGGGLDAEAVRDTVASFLSGSGRVSVNHNDSRNALTISVSDPAISDVTDLQDALDGKADKDDARTNEQIRDTIAKFILGGQGIDAVHDNSANTLTLNFTGDSGGVTKEQARDAVASMMRGVDGITVAHDDSGDTITIGYAARSAAIDLDAIMADSPTALYMLDDDGGTTAVDSSGNGRDGSYEGNVEHGAAPVAGGTTASVRLPGGTDGAPRVLLGQGSPLIGSTVGNTIEAWFNADDVQRGQVIAEAGATNSGLSLQIENGLLHAVTSEAPNTISVPIEAGVDYHAAGVWASDDHITLYLQGVEAKSVTPGSPAGLDAGNDFAAIGAVASKMARPDNSEALDGTLGFAGRLAPVVFYDKPLSGDRIASHVTTVFDALGSLSQSLQDHVANTDNPHNFSPNIEDIAYVDPSGSGRSGSLDEVVTRLFDEKRSTNQLYGLPMTPVPCSATPGPNDGEITIQWDQPEYGEADWYAVMSRIIDPRGGSGSGINGLPRMNFVAEVRGSRTEYVDTPFFAEDRHYYRVIAVGGPVASATPQ